MDKIIQFQPLATSTAKNNLSEFVKLCRDELTAFGSDCWKENLWKTPYEKSRKNVVARFSTNTKPYDSYHYEPLNSPFIEFAKAYIRYTYSLNAVSNLQRHLEALRGIEESLISVNGKADILDLDGAIIDVLPNILAGKYRNAVALNKIGYQVEKILNFCRTKQITPSLPEWSNPFGKQKDLTIALDDKGQEHRSSKLPTDEEMMLVAQLFHDAPGLGLEVEYYTAIMALLMVAPSRGSEVTTLPVNCLEWEEDKAGIKKLGIRWTPAKGGKAGLKWVPTTMEDVVVEAVKRLERIGEPARAAAKFAEENPNLFMRHEHSAKNKHIGEDVSITIDELNSALSTSFKYLKLKPPTPKWLIKVLEDNNRQITYRTLGKHEYNKYTSGFNNWPFIDKASKVKASEALLLHRENELHADYQARNFSFLLQQK